MEDKLELQPAPSDDSEVSVPDGHMHTSVRETTPLEAASQLDVFIVTLLLGGRRVRL